jgi:predicted metal-dependent peptidase
VELANRERPDVMIYLTDGFAGPLSTPPHIPLMWLITPSGLLPTHPSWTQLPGRKVKMS